MESAYNNKELVFKEVKHALSKIADTAQAVGRGERHPFEEIGFLANALDELMVCVFCVCFYNKNDVSLLQ